MLVNISEERYEELLIRERLCEAYVSTIQCQKCFKETGKDFMCLHCGKDPNLTIEQETAWERRYVT